MPGTRAQSKSRGPVGATAAVERAAPVENSTSADPPAVSQGNRAEMSGIPNKLDDPNIILLRAKVTKSQERMLTTPKLTSLIKLGSLKQLLRGLPLRVLF